MSAKKMGHQPAAAKETKPAPTASTGRMIRETVESIVVAFILAFLFRTFEAEAFVIPTGSMAPSLQGRHKDFECPACGYQYRSSASEEVLDEEDQLRFRQLPSVADRQVVAATCPMCRYQDNNAAEQPSYNGDRILVAKFPFDFSEPQRWDVIVFKYPGDAKVNYIKRLVGLPGESIQISHGDIHLATSVEDADLGVVGPIQRKPADKLLAMLQIVYDNKYFPTQLSDLGWPERWRPEGEGWKTGRDANRRQWFETDGKATGPTWIRYQHVVPTWENWQRINAGRWTSAEQAAPEPQLITDFYAYNTNENRATFTRMGGRPEFQKAGVHWVGDLAVECEVDIQGSRGTLLLELTEGAVGHTCQIDVATGRATLGIEGVEGYSPQATTGLRGPGKHEVQFANVDDQLTLWVDGSVVEFDSATTFDPAALKLPNDLPGRGDVEHPARIGSHGAALRIGRVKLWRDIYYISGTRTDPHRGIITDYDLSLLPASTRDSNPLTEIMTRPWLPENQRVFESAAFSQFTMEDDQFFVLGDNSPYSKDSRLWEQDGYNHFVGRDLLIGKALFVYWPHSEHKIPGTKIPFPYFPNFKRMGFAR